MFGSFDGEKGAKDDGGAVWIDHKCLKAYIDGAQGRNRTTDTRIINPWLCLPFMGRYVPRH